MGWSGELTVHGNNSRHNKGCQAAGQALAATRPVQATPTDTLGPGTQITARDAERIAARQLTGVLQTVSDGVAIWARDGSLQLANATLCALCSETDLTFGRLQLADFIASLVDECGETPDLDPVEHGPGAPIAYLVHKHAPEQDPDRLVLRVLRLGTLGDDSTNGYVTVLSKLNADQKTLAALAHFDALTGLPNRRMLRDRMRQLLAHHRRAQRMVAVCYLDLDGFKAVNDQHGHQAGDRLLLDVAQRLNRELRVEDTVARIGGDEFVVLIADLEGRGDAEPVLHRILDALAQPYIIEGQKVVGVSASIGATLFPRDDQPIDVLLDHADHAMYVAKADGKNRYQWFEPHHEQRLRAQQQALEELHDALRNGELTLYYQPVVDCRRGSITGAEALLRWQHPILGLLPPLQFLPLVENSDLAIEIGDLVFAQVVRQVRDWQKQSLPITVSVNLFARQLRQPDFVANLADHLATLDSAAGTPLMLELNEHQKLPALDEIRALADQCAALGVTFALDDFASANSPLEQLSQLPLGTLSIDRRVIRGLEGDAHQRALIRAVIGLGRTFEHEVIAKGVENEAQLKWLLAAGCSHIQGFHIAAPMPPEAFAAWARAFRADPAWADYLHKEMNDGGQATAGFR